MSLYILNVEVFAISSSSTIENGDMGIAHAQRELPIWDVEKSFFNIMKNENNLFVQGLIDNIFGCFVFVRKYFKGWGASASRACAGRRPAPPYLEILSFKRTKTNMLPIRPWTRGVVSVSHYVEQSFFDGLNWKLPLRVRFPHVPIFKCRRRTNCEKFGADRFSVSYVLKMLG